ncbi:MAG: hypothetical protein MPJ05_07845 [Nitrosopumilus sp.]|nr:hypothetical protein [Nitrosopumilus sp.]CAI9831812.1 hypothetical protein IBTHAUMO2_450018 [Nitrosopumilaceae archaeon]MDA7942158.1 hypothetical protein [Nitrosopumilus sp.]MDA7953706.1 hypothetical protein [Nitrosopumilus sp.]MDA7955323.1 hypothetical protein [Nitrosopumilus sp.]
MKGPDMRGSAPPAAVLDETAGMARRGPGGRDPKKPKTFYDILDEIRRNNRTAVALGAEFERLTKIFLRKDSVYSDTLDKVAVWKECPETAGTGRSA